MSKIYLDLNLGLGDMIISNGLIRELAKVHEKLIIPCHPHYVVQCEEMFGDLLNVIFTCREGSKDSLEILSIGCNNPKFKDFRSFDVAFYELAGIPFEKRWSSFHMPTVNPIYCVHKDYILKHDDASRGFFIQERHLNKTYPILDFKGSDYVGDYIPLIENASEIHCIDSSIIHLVDSVNPRHDCQLFYHKYARNNGPFHQTVKKLKWEVLE